jgi:DNA-binding NtrC family response regulator
MDAEKRLPSPSIELVGRSSLVGRLRETVRRSASLDGAILIVAERGCDVESIAREIHHRSRGGDAAWRSVECGEEDGPHLERILFGSVDGTTASDVESISATSAIGSAAGGTLFLQDATELPAAVQARLARLIRDGEASVDGHVASTNFRVIASVSPSVDRDVRDHRFRADLHRRLSASRIEVPALRERPDDVPFVVSRLLEEAGDAGRSRTLTQAALALLCALSWPGNVAELRGLIARVLRETQADAIQVEHVLPALQLDRPHATFVPAGSLREARQRFERDYIGAVLKHHGWRMAEAAQTLGIQRPNLYRKARQLGIPLARVAE